MTFTFSSAQKAELDALINSSATDRYADAYAKVLEFIDGQPDVPSNVEAWFRGAEKVNREEGPFSDFIRSYTSAQLQLRTGETLTGSQLDQASNLIAQEVVSGIVTTG